MPYPCFFLEPTDEIEVSLRRYHSPETGTPGDCPRLLASGGALTYHDASVPLGRMTAPRLPNNMEPSGPEQPDHADARSPRACACGFPFAEDDIWQVFTRRVYVRLDIGETMSLRDAPPGALYFATWLEEYEGYPKGPDGRILYCHTPGGEWNVDSIASNCTMPGDKVHRCWIRHGDPRDPQGLKTGKPLHVDKNGHTCGAGAGSIVCGNYHGFLHNGLLTDHC